MSSTLLSQCLKKMFRAYIQKPQCKYRDGTVPSRIIKDRVILVSSILASLLATGHYTSIRPALHLLTGLPPSVAVLLREHHSTLPTSAHCQHHQMTAYKKALPSSLPSWAHRGMKSIGPAGCIGLRDGFQSHLCLCFLTFSLIHSFRLSNAIINKDHKQVEAFIFPKFMVQKRGFSG